MLTKHTRRDIIAWHGVEREQNLSNGLILTQELQPSSEYYHDVFPFISTSIKVISLAFKSSFTGY